jgi:hypothetical protein
VEFGKVAALVTGFLEREKVPFALAGALALHAYGLSRATLDLDFVAEASGRDRIVAFLESLGYESLHVSEGYSNHLHRDPVLGRVDFIYVRGETARRLFAAPGAMLHFDHGDVPVPRAEHLIAMKIHAMKNDPARSLQELADIRFLMRVSGVDREEIRGYFEKAGFGKEHDDLERSL